VVNATTVPALTDHLLADFEVGEALVLLVVAGGVTRLVAKHLRQQDPRQAYGVPSGVNNVLILNKVIAPGRVTTIIVRESSASDRQTTRHPVQESLERHISSPERRR
jgi:hypothetical protein